MSPRFGESIIIQSSKLKKRTTTTMRLYYGYPFGLLTFLSVLISSSRTGAVGTTQAAKLQSDGSCPLLTFIPFTDLRQGPPEEILSPGEGPVYGYGQWSSAQALGKASFSLLAAAQMAKDHFNAREPSVVPALTELGSWCDVTIPDNWYIDSGYSRSKAVQELMAIQRNSTDPDNSICAVIGPLDPRANEGASVLTENLGIPQIAYETIDKRLSRKQDFPTFVRGIPVVQDFAKAIALYLADGTLFHRNFVAIIYAQSDFGEQFEDPLEDAEEDLGYTTITEHFLETDHDSIVKALQNVVDEGYHTIFVAADRSAIINDLARVAVEELDTSLVGDDYFWILTGDIAAPELFQTLRFEPDSPSDMLMRGAALVTNYDPFVYEPDGDAFLDAWKIQGDELLDRLSGQHPLSPSDPAYYLGESGYFQNEIPTEFASFLYDAIITAGMSACRSKENGSQHIDEVFKSDFKGGSGRVVYKEGENGRDPVGVKFGVYNVRPGELDEATNTRGYTRHLTAIYNGATGKWTSVDAHVFFDGTAQEPMPLRETTTWHYLSPSARIWGFALTGLSYLNILIHTTWIFLRRKERIVTASQPQFLYAICFGAALMVTSLIFVSFDESNGWSEDKLDAACSAFPWFFAIGYLVQYCAAFSKLWRLSKLLSMRRGAVGIKQVLLPFSLIIASSLVVLILWQILDPFHWERSLMHDYYAEDPWESYGSCQSTKYGANPFVIPLGVLFGIIIVMTLAISWKMRHVQSELSEARWIFIAIFSHLQIWAIGIPVFIILDGVSRDASYLITMALVFIFSNTFICGVVGPRMYADIRKTYFCKSGVETPKIPKISMYAAGTHVSGLQNTTTNSSSTNTGYPSASFEEDKSKILQLEAEVEELTTKLVKYENNKEKTDEPPQESLEKNEDL